MYEIKEKAEKFVKESFDKLGIETEDVIFWGVDKLMTKFDVLAKNESVYTFSMRTYDLLKRVVENKFFTKEDLEQAKQIYSYREL